MADESTDIQEVKEWKSGPEVDGLNDMVKGINACIKWINAQNKGGVQNVIVRDEENTTWVRLQVRAVLGDEVEGEVCSCSCSCNSGGSGGGDVGSV